MKKILIIIAIIMIIVLSNQKEYYVIPKNSLRFRVIANSNTINDQKEKIKVKNIITEELEKDLKDSKTIESSRKIIKDNLSNYNKLISKIIEKDFKIDFGYNYFPEKVYRDVKYEEGYYESLVITLGEGSGDNFWCVLFPPICNLDFDENKKDIEYKFLVKDIIEKYIK